MKSNRLFFFQNQAYQNNLPKAFSTSRNAMNSIENKHNDPNSIRLIYVFGMLYAFLLIYASLMPFDIGATHNIEKTFSRFWDDWPIDPNADISGSDVMSNLLLYMPLGWIVAVGGVLRGVSGPVAIVIATTVCMLLSFAVEMTQMILDSRFSSGADWVLNTISGALGSIAGVAFGKRIWFGGLRWFQVCWQTRPAAIGTLMFIILLAADAWAPYLPTLLLKQIWRSLEGSHFNALEGLALYPWHWWVMTRIMLYMLLTVLLVSWGGRKDVPSLGVSIGASVGAAGLAFVLEIGKIFIASRTFNIANVLTSCFGSLAGAVIAIFFLDKVSPLRKLESMCAVIFIYMIYLWWFPFDFTWNVDNIQKGLPTFIEILPLYHYAMGAELNHIRLFVQSIFLLGLLTFLLRTRFGWTRFKRGGIFISAGIAGIFGMVLEGGQLLLPSRTPSMTDVYCFAAGASIGAWIPMPKIAHEASQPNHIAHKPID